jgi:cytochrome c oxidase cbb3-type subunit 1
MLDDLTKSERYLALGLAIVVALAGLFLASLGRDTFLGVHGWIILIFGLIASLGIVEIMTRGGPDPQVLAERRKAYYDMPSQAGIVLAMIWAVFALFVGDWVAWELAFPDLNLGLPWTNFGRLRPVHTTGIIFGFGGNALIATSFHVVQRTSRARLPDALSPSMRSRSGTRTFF